MGLPLLICQNCTKPAVWPNSGPYSAAAKAARVCPSGEQEYQLKGIHGRDRLAPDVNLICAMLLPLFYLCLYTQSWMVVNVDSEGVLEFFKDAP